MFSTIFGNSFLYLLKNVEIVIIQQSLWRDDETAGFKSFGEPIAHILCALFAGRYELCVAISDIHWCFYDRFNHKWGQYGRKSIIFLDICDNCTYVSGRIFKERTTIGTNNNSKNTTL